MKQTLKDYPEIFNRVKTYHNCHSLTAYTSVKNWLINKIGPSEDYDLLCRMISKFMGI